MKRILPLLVFLFSISVSAQKIVYSEPYDLKNNPFDSKLLSGKILEDSVSKNRLMIISGMKDISFYLMDSNWKLVKKFNKPLSNETVLKSDFFKILKYKYDQQKWVFIGQNFDRYTRETVDFSSQTHLVQTNILSDLAGIQLNFTDGEAHNLLYYTKDKDIRVAGFGEDLKPKPVLLKISTGLPLSKSAKFKNEDIYNNIEIITGYKSSDPFFTRRKSHFYILKDAYALLLFSDEPVAELTWYDKQTGKAIKSRLFSVEELLGKDAKKDFNTAALLYEGKVYVLTAFKSGGVFAAFDAETVNKIYSQVYSEKDENTVFSYGPVTYETLPGTISTSVLKEKLDDISMDKFCKEMYKHSCAVTAKKTAKYGLLVTLANYEPKELAAATSHLRSGLNTMTSPDWYESTSAGLLFDPATMALSKKKIGWNEANKSEATNQYKKVKPARTGYAEYSDKKAFFIALEFIQDRSYVIYYFNGQLKVDESQLGYRPEKNLLD
jgi:hypothetical protein